MNGTTRTTPAAATGGKRTARSAPRRGRRNGTNKSPAGEIALGKEYLDLGRLTGNAAPEKADPAVGQTSESLAAIGKTFGPNVAAIHQAAGLSPLLPPAEWACLPALSLSEPS